MNDIIPEDVLKTLEERFGSRFVRRTDGKAPPDAHDTVASVFPQSGEEVESLTRLAARLWLEVLAPPSTLASHRGASRCVSTRCARFGSRRERKRIG